MHDHFGEEMFGQPVMERRRNEFLSTKIEEEVGYRFPLRSIGTYDRALDWSRSYHIYNRLGPQELSQLERCETYTNGCNVRDIELLLIRTSSFLFPLAPIFLLPETVGCRESLPKILNTWKRLWTWWTWLVIGRRFLIIGLSKIRLENSLRCGENPTGIFSPTNMQDTLKEPNSFSITIPKGLLFGPTSPNLHPHYIEPQYKTTLQAYKHWRKRGSLRNPTPKFCGTREVCSEDPF